METSVSNLYSVDRIYIHLPILGSLLTDFLNRSKIEEIAVTWVQAITLYTV